jgi:ABC-type uncharacterized transport system permease subunit
MQPYIFADFLDAYQSAIVLDSQIGLDFTFLHFAASYPVFLIRPRLLALRQDYVKLHSLGEYRTQIPPSSIR